MQRRPKAKQYAARRPKAKEYAKKKSRKKQMEVKGFNTTKL
jgi:hypothetical protein